MVIDDFACLSPPWRKKKGWNLPCPAERGSCWRVHPSSYTCGRGPSFGAFGCAWVGSICRLNHKLSVCSCTASWNVHNQKKGSVFNSWGNRKPCSWPSSSQLFFLVLVAPPSASTSTNTCRGRCCAQNKVFFPKTVCDHVVLIQGPKFDVVEWKSQWREQKRFFCTVPEGTISSVFRNHGLLYFPQSLQDEQLSFIP